jgi:threonine synthase
MVFFDDCQDMVKKTFPDDVNILASINSINIALGFIQMFLL